MEFGTLALKNGVGVDELAIETSNFYSQIKPVVAALQLAYDDAQSDRRKNSVRVHAHWQRMLGLGLAIVLVFNCLLRALDPTDVEADNDARAYCDKVVQLSDEAAVYRPLGSGYFSMCLIAAWAASDDLETRMLLRKKLLDFRSDFSPGVPVGTLDLELDYIYQRLFLLKY